MQATAPVHCSGVLYLAMELGRGKWKLGFSDGIGRRPRIVEVPACDLLRLEREIERAKGRFGLPWDAPVKSCHEAGRDGFWPHRWLSSRGVENVVVDSSSIEVKRQARRAKSDSLDATKLLTMLIRYDLGERRLWSVVHVPTPEAEDQRQLHREIQALTEERTAHGNRIGGLLATIGLELPVEETFPQRLEAARLWDGSRVREGLKQRLLREWERWKLVDQQLRGLRSQERREVRDDSTPQVDKIRLLMGLRGVGVRGGSVLVRELFGWRELVNRRQVAAVAGMTPTPFHSGQSEREQGISKAGNKRVRRIIVQLAWCWLRYQPESALSRWYQRRFAAGSSRTRKIGIVALGRKLLVAFWRLAEKGEIPLDAQWVDWREKLSGRLVTSAQVGR